MIKKTIIVLMSCFVLGVLLNHQLFSNKLLLKHRGVSWVAGPKPVSAKDFDPLVKNHVNWIVQTPFGWQKKVRSPNVKLVTDGFVFWGEKDLGLKATTELAKAAGIKTLLKPHIWLQYSENGKWRGEIAMDNEANWQRWFASYKKFIFHYAKLAEENHIEALAIGTELYVTAIQREQDWRDVIATVRKVYHGELTYSANWYKEFEEIKFWDALDYIGIQGYFPLTEKENPSIDELKKSWQPYLNAIEKVSKKFNKPVIFTEIGYKSIKDTAARPWEWPGRFIGTSSETDLIAQANCYEAFFQVFWQKKWFAGVYFWKWFPGLNRSVKKKDFTPQNKPAEEVMAKWFEASKS